MSVILYHQGTLVADSSSTISGRLLNYPNLFNVSKANKLNFSTSKMSVFGSVGVIMSEREYRDLADMLENTIITSGELGCTDDALTEYLKNLYYRLDSSIHLFFMTAVDRSSHFINVSLDDNNKLMISLAALGERDVITMGSGGLLAFTAVKAGLGPIEAVEYAIRRDPNASGPIRYVTMNDLNKADGV